MNTYDLLESLLYVLQRIADIAMFVLVIWALWFALFTMVNLFIGGGG